MEKELLVKVAFACMACDGEIDATEIDCIQQVFANNDLINKESLSVLLNELRDKLNLDSKAFFNTLFAELSDAVMSESEELELIEVAIKIIEADNVIDYNEVKLLKKIRSYLKINDKVLLNAMPDKEDYIASDINRVVDFLDDFSSNINIKEIQLH
ncbi:MAG: TerB family tellurite resistance protein [Rikenellaceae bacterium]